MVGRLHRALAPGGALSGRLRAEAAGVTLTAKAEVTTMLMGGPACESCGRPMTVGASGKYCDVCTDAGGALLAYDEVHRRLVEREFMGRNGMSREQAEVAARNALSRMPAWRGGR